MPVRRERDELPPAATTVGIISDHGMADRGEVDANLVGAPGVQVRAHQVGGVEAREPEEVRLGGAAAADDGHALPVARVAGKGRVHGQRIRGEVTPRERRVPPCDSASRDGGTEHAMGAIRLCDEEETGRLFVEPMHDPRGRRPRRPIASHRAP